MWPIYILLLLMAGVILWLSFAVRKEQRKNKILRAFVAGIVRSITDYKSPTDDKNDPPKQNEKIPIAYTDFIKAVEHELLKNQSVRFKSMDKYLRDHKSWLVQNRALFTTSLEDDGFVFMNYDLFDDLLKLWNAPAALISEREKGFLSDYVEVTDKNADELKGEVGMFEDLFDGKLDSSNINKENIDTQLLLMFNHIKAEKRDELKREIIKRNNL